MLRELGFVVIVVWVPVSCIDTMKWSWVAVVTMWSWSPSWTGWKEISLKIRTLWARVELNGWIPQTTWSVWWVWLSWSVWLLWHQRDHQNQRHDMNILDHTVCLHYLIPICALRTPSQAKKNHFTVFHFCSQTAWFRTICRHDDFPDCLDPTATLFYKTHPHFSLAEQKNCEQKNTLFCCSWLVGKKASSWGGEVNLAEQTCSLVNKRLISC